MRPAWFSGNDSPRDNDGRDNLGKSSQNSSMESMINAAKGHFTATMTPSPPPQPSTTKAKTIDFSSSNNHDASKIALSDHMDSFPLIPLHIIPQLNAEDLRKCEGGVSELLSTLTISEEDIQLSKYAARELSLIRRHLEEHRARERVLRLLSGDLSLELTSMEPRHTPRRISCSTTNKDESTYSKTSSTISQENLSKSDIDTSKFGSSQKTSSGIPRSDTPRATVVATPKASPLNNNQSKLPESWKKTVTGVLSTQPMFKKAIASFPMTSFVISGSGKRRRKLKRNKPQETEEIKKAKLDKGREQRRQAALQRLEARQQLQKKKHEEKQKQTNSTASTSFVNISAPSDQQNMDLSDTDTDVSDVSNCSENEDEAEKRIQELIPNPLAEQDTDEDSSDEGTVDDNAHDDSNSITDDTPTQENDKEPNEREEITNENTYEFPQNSSYEFPQNSSSTLPSPKSNNNSINTVDLKKTELTNEPSVSPKLNSPNIRDDTANKFRVKSPNSTPRSLLVNDVKEQHPNVDIEVLNYASSNDLAAKSECELLEKQERANISRGEARTSITSGFSQSPITDLSSNIIQQIHVEEAKIDRSKQEALEAFVKLRQPITESLTNTLDNYISQLSLSHSVEHQSQCIDSHSAAFETKCSPTFDDQHKGNGTQPEVKLLLLSSCRETVPITFEEEAEKQEKSSSHLRLRRRESTDSNILKTNDNNKNESTRMIPANAKKNTTKPSRRKMISSTSTSAIAIGRIPSKDVKDYTGVISNFFNIMTSFYEQFQHNNKPLGSRDTLHLQNGDNAMRIQMKLYESWQSIMYDYATVFGTCANQVTDGAKNATGHIYSSQATSFTAHYRINSTNRNEVFDIVVEALKKLPDWEEHPNGLGLKTTWNLLWTWSKPRVERKTLLMWQKVNHFHGAKALTRKDQLKKNIYRYLGMGGKMKQYFDIVPQTFLLPQEYVPFVQAFRDRGLVLNPSSNPNSGSEETSESISGSEEGPSAPKQNIWIMKPVALSRGRGISLLNDLSQVVYGEPVVVQQYIENPLLLDGYKFDLRLYVLVTSFNPLEAFFYEEGFVRLCTHRYTEDANQIDNLFIHLTNSSIQKFNEDASTAKDNPINTAAGVEAGGTKATLAYFWKRLEAMGADIAKVKNDILEVIVKSLVCGEDHIDYQVNSFDLLGYDILLDSSFRPWLIEINSSPSMARENDLDYQVKDALMLDTIKLVNPLHFDRSKLVEVFGRRLHDMEQEKKRAHLNIRHPKEAEEIAKRQLNEDLTEILRGAVPRQYGEMPEHLGQFTRIAPYSNIHNQVSGLSALA